MALFHLFIMRPTIAYIIPKLPYNCQCTAFTLLNAAEFTLIAKMNAMTIQIWSLLIAHKRFLHSYSYIFTIDFGLTYVQQLFDERHLTR